MTDFNGSTYGYGQKFVLFSSFFNTFMSQTEMIIAKTPSLLCIVSSILWQFGKKRFISFGSYKVIREKARGEGFLIEQDTIENVSEPNFFFLTF